MYRSAEPLRNRLVEFQTEMFSNDNPRLTLTKCQPGLNEYLYSASQYPGESAQAKLLINTRRMAFIASHLNDNDYHAEAEQIARDAVRFTRLHTKPGKYRALPAFTSLASICSHLGNVEESEELYREAIDLEGLEKEIDKDLPLIMAKLASVLLQAARCEDAKNMAFEASMMLSQLSELDEQVVSLNATTLATAYAEQGRYHDAELVSSSTFSQKQPLRSNPEDLTISFVSRHLDVLENLAQTYNLSARHQQAESIYKTVSPVRTQLRGPTHLQTLQTVARHMGTLNSQARYAEDLDLSLECEQLFHQRKMQSISYDAHLLAGSIQREIAISYHGLGDPNYAEQFARRALEPPSGAVGPVHPHTLDCLSVLVPILCDQGGETLNAAKTKGEELLKGQKLLLEDNNIKTIQAMEILAETYDRLGDHERARSLNDQAK